MNSHSRETLHAFNIVGQHHLLKEFLPYIIKNKERIDFEEQDEGSNLLNKFCLDFHKYPPQEALEILDFLIDNTIYLNATSKEAQPLVSVLSRAPVETMEAAVNLLLDARIDVNSNFSHTPLMMAAANLDNPELLKKIISLSSDETFFAQSEDNDYFWGSQRKATAAHYAAHYGKLENLKILIEEGIDMGVVNAIEQTPLQTLYAQGFEEEVQVLLKEYPELLDIEYQKEDKVSFNKDYYYDEEEKEKEMEWKNLISISYEKKKLENSIQAPIFPIKPKSALQKI